MKNKFLVAGIIVLGICFSSCKTKNKPSDNIDLGISNNSLNNEQIDVEIFTNGKQFFKKKLIKSFYFEKHRLRPGNYLLKISIKNRNLSNTYNVAVEEDQSYLMTLDYTYTPPFDSAKFFIVKHAIKNRVIKQQDSSLFLKDVENNKASYKESPRKIRFEFINRKNIGIN